jgi:methylaspartate mutase epsilon subunit
MDEDEFFRERKQVLSTWPTGRDVDLDDAVFYHKNMPRHKNLVNKLSEAKRSGNTLIHNLCGFTTLSQQMDLLLHLQNVGKTDLLHCIYDSFTRTSRFEQAEQVLRECEATGKNMLNGFPVVNYGVPGNRRLMEAVDRPITALGPSTDPRLATEIALASGYTELIINTFINFETYTKAVPLEEIMGYSRYCCRLVGYYQERGVSIAVAVPGGASGSNAPGIAPPSLGTAGTILGALLTAAQGPKYCVSFNPSQGNIAQDVASSLTRMKLIREYLDRFGYEDVELFIENGGLGGQYPIDFDEAFAEVLYAPIVSALSGAQLCQIKTFDESSGIPTKENQARSLRGSRMMYNIMRIQHLDFVNSWEVRAEAEIEEREARAIVEKVLELGGGDPVDGALKAYEFGVLDNPVANNPRVKSKVMGVKDSHGAVRYLNCGNLPFTKDMMEFHREKIAAREKLSGKKADYDTIVSDIRAIANGEWLHGE